MKGVNTRLSALYFQAFSLSHNLTFGKLHLDHSQFSATYFQEEQHNHAADDGIAELDTFAHKTKATLYLKVAVDLNRFLRVKSIFNVLCLYSWSDILTFPNQSPLLEIHENQNAPKPL